MKGLLAVMVGAFMLGVAILAAHGALAQGGGSDRPGDSFIAKTAEKRGMSTEDFKAALLQSVKAKLDAKVADGTISQQQADRAYTATQGKIDEIVQFKGGSDAAPCRRWRDGEKEALPTATS